jgi:hypothetical protein
MALKALQILVALAILASLPVPARASLAGALLPDHARLQFAGGLGLLSGGAGYGFLGDRVQAELLYGYAPAAAAGKAVHTLSQKTTFAPLVLGAGRRIAFCPVLAGVSANVALGDDYFLILPEKYRDYYWPSALRFWIFGGTRATFAVGPGPVRRLSAVAEVGAADVYWQAYIRNDFVELRDILSLALSLQAHFGGD